MLFSFVFNLSSLFFFFKSLMYVTPYNHVSLSIHDNYHMIYKVIETNNYISVRVNHVFAKAKG